MKGNDMADMNEWPSVLRRFVEETGAREPDYKPRRIQRRFHGQNVVVWEGRVHVEDVEGYVENLRLKHYLNRWHARRREGGLAPTSDDIYRIMLEADEEEREDAKRPFHVRRLARSIAQNGVQEPIVIFANGSGKGELWDGNRRFFGTFHIMKDSEYTEADRDRAKWLPVHVVTPSGSPTEDQALRHRILTELNFVEKDHIPWPAYLKAEQIHLGYVLKTKADPTDPTLSRNAKTALATEYGLKSWRVADRWIKMYDLAMDFKEYHEEERHRDGVEVDLKIQEKFEYFDEMSKPGVWGALKSNPDARDEVFCWLWDDKFKSWADVRKVPQILADPVAYKQAQAPDADSVKRAIATVIANDPARVMEKEAANERIRQFADWMDSFKREDYRKLDAESLTRLRDVLSDVVRLLGGLLSQEGPAS